MQTTFDPRGVTAQLAKLRARSPAMALSLSGGLTMPFGTAVCLRAKS
jgi:hypothetical protein